MESRQIGSTLERSDARGLCRRDGSETAQSPADQCPFDRSLAMMLPIARATVAEGRVHVGFLPQALQGTPPRRSSSNSRTTPSARTFTYGSTH
jgi:hypothetical protein